MLAGTLECPGHTAGTKRERSIVARVFDCSHMFPQLSHSKSTIFPFSLLQELTIEPSNGSPKLSPWVERVDRPTELLCHEGLVIVLWVHDLRERTCLQALKHSLAMSSFRESKIGAHNTRYAFGFAKPQMC